MALARQDTSFNTEAELEALLLEFLEHFNRASGDRVFQQMMIQAALH